ncbi:hypothetical protein ACIF8T_12550 [Streptomyces sp. NPDC085946]|uniref:hypothetical protein n=1 Tax=Streptomyces sp. NPDC085946 TaxID=3365744 RepID=UPI0037D1CFC9
MGAFYGNVLVARACEEVVPLLAGVSGPDGEVLRGYAMAVGPRHAVIHPEEETGALEWAGTLSRLLGAPALGTYLFDSDVLVMRVYEDGELRHGYDSCPGYFDEDDRGGAEDGEDEQDADFDWPAPLGADPGAFLPLAAGPVDLPALESVLRGVPLDPEDGEDGRYVFADAQHCDVLALLSLDASRLSTGYTHLSREGLPPDTAPDDVWLLGGATFDAG